MTIAKTHCRKEYTGDGVVLVYPYDFYIGSTSELLVYVAGTLKTLGVDYTISGVGSEAGGNVTFVAGSVPAAAASIVLLRSTPQTQATDLTAGGKFYESDIEEMVDRDIRILQEIQEKLGRVPVLPATALLSNLALPAPGAGLYLRWNSAGTALEAVPVSQVALLSLLLDCVITAPADGQILTYEAASSKWKNLGMGFDFSDNPPVDNVDTIGIRFKVTREAGDSIGWTRLWDGTYQTWGQINLP